MLQPMKQTKITGLALIAAQIYFKTTFTFLHMGSY
jgi:hypothetical protein